MFAQSILDRYTSDIHAISGEIQALEAHLNELREHQKQLEAERQAMATLASAGQSAIDQCRQFLTLATRSDRQDLITSFWDELDVIRNDGHAVADLPEVSEVVTECEDLPEDEQLDAINNETPTIEVESEEITDNDDFIEVNGNNYNGNGNGHHHSKDDLKTLLEGESYQTLKKLTSRHNLDAKGKKHDLITRLLGLGLTYEEIVN